RTELLTCRDIVEAGRHPYTGRMGTLSPDDHSRVDEAMKTAHVEELAERDFMQISDGQRQRVMLARAIAQDPRVLVLDDGSEIACDVALAATGRAPATAALGLDTAGVAVTPRGAVIVDDYSRTNVPSIFAIGDVTDRVTLTPVAIREGHALADTLFGNKPTMVHHTGIATAVFTQAPVGVVGLSEAAAVAAGHDVQVFRSTFRPMRNAFVGRDDKTFMKLVIDRATRKVLGVHMVGADAPEIIQMAAIAVTMGATKDDFDRTVAVHPTAAEEFVLMRG
ncbi:MAG TPA: FAD-dependent oxidoreductase, partial [Kofleriaceae bacterium]|nr:FAD-dependent oxidoreductase [Kofleriaceae bacterium]